MSAYVQTNVRLFVGGADLTGQSNKVETGATVEEKDATTYASGGWKERVGALGDSAIVASGFWNAGDNTKVDDLTWASLGTLGGMTTCPNDAQVGNVAWLQNVLTAKYALGAQVGEIAPFQLDAAGSWPMSRGLVLHPPGTARTSTGTGTATQLTAVAAGQFLYATVHVLSATGTTPSITVKVQSNVDNTFGAPTDRITFAAAGATGGQIARLAGPVTDTWYRAQWTISGGSPSFLFVVAIGIK